MKIFFFSRLITSLLGFNLGSPTLQALGFFGDGFSPMEPLDTGPITDSMYVSQDEHKQAWSALPQPMSKPVAKPLQISVSSMPAPSVSSVSAPMMPALSVTQPTLQGSFTGRPKPVIVTNRGLTGPVPMFNGPIILPAGVSQPGKKRKNQVQEEKDDSSSEWVPGKSLGSPILL